MWFFLSLLAVWVEGGCEHGGLSVVRGQSTQTPVAPSALSQALSPMEALLISLLTLCCYCSVQRPPSC